MDRVIEIKRKMSLNKGFLVCLSRQVEHTQHRLFFNFLPAGLMFYSKSGAYCKGMFKLPETHFYVALPKPETYSLLTDLSLIRRLSKCVHFHHVVYGHTQVSLFVYIVILSLWLPSSQKEYKRCLVCPQTHQLGLLTQNSTISI